MALVSWLGILPCSSLLMHTWQYRWVKEVMLVGLKHCFAVLPGLDCPDLLRVESGT